MKFKILLAVSIITISFLNAQPWTNVGNGLTEPVKKLIVHNSQLFAITTNPNIWSGPTNTNIWDSTNWTTFNDTLNIIDVAIKNDTLFALANEDIYYWADNSWEFYFDNYMSDYYQTQGYSEPIADNFFVYNNELYLFYGLPAKFHKIEGDSINLIGDANGPIIDIEEYNGNMCIAGCFTSINGIHSPHFIQYNGTEYLQAEYGFIIPCEANSITKYNNLIYIGGYNLYEVDTNTWGTDSTGKHLFIWNGTNIHPVTESPNNTVSIVETIDDKLFIGGDFTEIGSNQVNYIGYFNGANWINKGVNFSDSLHRIKSIVEYNGKVFIGGNFNINNISDTIKHIATFDINSNIDNLNNFSDKVKVFPNPCFNYTIFTMPDYSVENNYSLLIHNIYGSKIVEINNILSEKYLFKSSILENGYYIYKLTDKIKNKTYTGKIIVK